ncbi:hypothetical protein BDW75DRAFT_132266 [Aspergillus navahoensis]
MRGELSQVTPSQAPRPELFPVSCLILTTVAVIRVISLHIPLVRPLSLGINILYNISCRITYRTGLWRIPRTSPTTPNRKFAAVVLRHYHQPCRLLKILIPFPKDVAPSCLLLGVVGKQSSLSPPSSRSRPEPRARNPP